jgi:putative endonuclease
MVMGEGIDRRAIDRRAIGQRAEQRAADCLVAAGLTVVMRNYRCRMGELDIVALEHDVLVIAEVRLRADERFGGAAASVTARKQRRLRRAAAHLLLRHPSYARLPARFDVLLVPSDSRATVQWLRGAFGTS